MKKLLITFILSIVFLFTSCSFTTTQPNSLKVKKSTAKTSSYTSTTGLYEKVVSETPYYKIVYSDFMYSYYIYNETGETVKADGPLSRQPQIQLVDEKLIKFTVQTGTGIGTQWGYFYDLNKDRFSQNFPCIFDQFNEKVVYGTSNKIVIRDIFDVEKYYQEIISFEHPLSDSADPIKHVSFKEDGNCIEVVYLTGSDYKAITERIILH